MCVHTRVFWAIIYHSYLSFCVHHSFPTLYGLYHFSDTYMCVHTRAFTVCIRVFLYLHVCTNEFSEPLLFVSRFSDTYRCAHTWVFWALIYHYSISFLIPTCAYIPEVSEFLTFSDTYMCVHTSVFWALIIRVFRYLHVRAYQSFLSFCCLCQFSIALSRGKKKGLCGPSWIRTSTRIWQRLGDTELNHQTIWTIAYLWLLCFDKDIFAYNSTTKVKLKILVRVNHLCSYLLVFESCL